MSEALGGSCRLRFPRPTQPGREGDRGHEPAPLPGQYRLSVDLTLRRSRAGALEQPRLNQPRPLVCDRIPSGSASRN